AGGINLVREHFYRLFHWHSNVKVADLGNIKTGAKLEDTYSALQQVLGELSDLGKKTVILGGSHDLMAAQYNIAASGQQIVEATCVDAFLDMNTDSNLPS